MPNFGYKHTLESRKKMSESHKGMKLSDEIKKKISATNKGKKLTKEHKRKIGLAFKGRKLTDEHKRKLSEALKGHIPWIGGKHIPEKTKQKLRKLALGRKMSEEAKKKISIAFTGEGHPNWQGGITPPNRRVRNSLEMKLWRKSVFERDNFTCQKYGISGGKLVVHHINNFADFPEVRLAIDNGITLSKKAHKEFHKIYGYKNNTKEQLLEFLNRFNK